MKVTAWFWVLKKEKKKKTLLRRLSLRMEYFTNLLEALLILWFIDVEEKLVVI